MNKLFLLFFLSISTATFATHIVGGELTYKCLGNDQYELKLTVFRDCYTGVPPFDNPAAIGVFDFNNILVQDFRIDFISSDTLNPTLDDPCLVIPPNVCVETTTYVDTITLPFNPSGYKLAYQRCCRNETIINIVDPLIVGSTYYAEIDEQAQLACNSNPVFNDWPPLYICANRPIRFDHSATDIDGDSLVYELCTPFRGANQTIPQPQPPNNPPYSPVPWLPPFDLNNLLGGVPLAIDSETGLLTGIPDRIGQFVVGVCVNEYRDGELLSFTKRDFQYNVGICGQIVVAAIDTPRVKCGSLDVLFENFSTGATTYEWNINGDIFTSATPTYTFPDYGTYDILLIATDPSGCADTTTSEIRLEQGSLVADFTKTDLVCLEQLDSAVQFTNTSFDTESFITIINWDFGDGTTSTQNNPTHIYNSEGTYTVTLQVESDTGCIAQISKQVIVNYRPELTQIDGIEICINEPFEFMIEGSYFDNIIINPSNNTTINGTNISITPNEAAEYSVIVYDNENCADTAEFYIDAQECICGEPQVFLPNAFSPNDDGKNDRLYLRGNVIATFKLMIYDRWGKQVYYSENLSEYWDGTVNGQNAKADVYGYHLEVNCLNQEFFSKKGNITLIR